MYVYIFRFDNRRKEVISHINYFSAHKQKIFGTDFKFLAAIKHTLRTNNSGHYTCIIPDDSGYVEISDDTILQTFSKFPTGLKNIVLMFFERC